jgi:YihY family inner membrane protein
MDGLVGAIDRWQQGNRVAGFLYAVVKKNGNDRGGRLAAMITFYGFLSLFPLLLAAATILGFVFAGNPSTARRIENSALKQFPVVGADLHTGHLHGNNLALVVGVLGLLYGSLGVAGAVQQALDDAWAVPLTKRPGFVPRVVLGVEFFALLGAGVVLTQFLTSLGAVVGNSDAAGAVGLVVALVLNVALFVGMFTLLGPKPRRWRDHVVGAVIAGIGWQVLQFVGQFLVERDLRNTSQLYGQFAVVLGLISFLSVASQLIMYSVEVNTVLKRHLWPVPIRATPAVDEPPPAAFPTVRVAVIAAASLGAAALERQTGRR